VRTGKSIPALVAASVLLALATPARAQSIQVHGLLDLAQTGRGDAYLLNIQTEGDSPFQPWRLRVFAEGTASPQVSFFTQGVFHEPGSVYLEAAYVVYSPVTEKDLHLMAGKIPWPIGTYAARSYSDKNPFIGKPLMYQYHTDLYWYMLPPSADALVASAGTGQGNYYSGGTPTHMGMPVVDDGFWDTGAVLNGSLRPIEYAVGVTNGTPGWGNVLEDENNGKNVLGRVGLLPIPGLRIGASGSYGPYLVQGLDPQLPAGKTATDYNQKLAMADASLEFGHGTLISEAYTNVWENPTLGDLRVHGGYIEAQWTLVPGLVLAGRGEAMRFSTLRVTTGEDLPWDLDRDRYEAAICYRPERDIRIKGAWQRNHETYPTREQNHDLVALGLTVSF